MTFNWKQNQLRKMMIKRRKEKEEIKKLDNTELFKNLKEKRKPKQYNLPF